MANKKITIEIDYADSVQHDLADLTCWWEGFKMGIKLVDQYSPTPVADNGVKRVQYIIEKLKDQLIKLEENDIQTFRPTSTRIL